MFPSARRQPSGGSAAAEGRLDDFTRALVRRNPPGNGKYVSRGGSGTEVFKGTGRPDTWAHSVNIG